MCRVVCQVPTKVPTLLEWKRGLLQTPKGNGFDLVSGKPTKWHRSAGKACRLTIVSEWPPIRELSRSVNTAPLGRSYCREGGLSFIPVPSLVPVR